jgi:hypothetical protein
VSIILGQGQGQGMAKSRDQQSEMNELLTNQIKFVFQVDAWLHAGHHGELMDTQSPQ